MSRFFLIPMDYEEIINICNRYEAIDLWLESIKEESLNSGLKCAFYDGMFFLSNEKAQSLFKEALLAEREYLRKKVNALSKR